MVPESPLSTNSQPETVVMLEAGGSHGTSLRDSLVGVHPNYHFGSGDDHALVLGGDQSGQAQEQLISPASGGSMRNPKNTFSLNLKNLTKLEKNE